MPQAQAGVGDPESFHMLVQRIAPPPDAPGVQGRTLAHRLISERKTSIVSRGGEQRETRDHGATRVIRASWDVLGPREALEALE